MALCSPRMPLYWRVPMKPRLGDTSVGIVAPRQSQQEMFRKFVCCPQMHHLSWLESISCLSRSPEIFIFINKNSETLCPVETSEIFYNP